MAPEVSVSTQPRDPGSSRITARAVARRGCLRWLDVARMNGGAGSPAWIEAK